MITKDNLQLAGAFGVVWLCMLCAVAVPFVMALAVVVYLFGGPS